jgi:hypothetical protein
MADLVREGCLRLLGNCRPPSYTVPQTNAVSQLVKVTSHKHQPTARRERSLKTLSKRSQVLRGTNHSRGVYEGSGRRELGVVVKHSSQHDSGATCSRGEALGRHLILGLGIGIWE